MRIVKISLALLGGIAVLLIAGLAIVAATFDPNDYKRLVTDEFAARTGRTLTIEQDLRLSYFPWLAVETGGIRVGSAAAFGGDATPFATADTVAARVKLMPLFQRRVEIGTVEITGLTLNLARDANLQGNWQDLSELVSATPPQPAAGRAPATLAIEGVRIRDGNVFWRDNGDQLRYSVTGLDLATGAVDANEPVSFTAALNFKDESSSLLAQVEAEAVAQVAAGGSVTATAVEVDITASPGDGTAPRQLRAAASRAAFDRATQTLAVEGLRTSVAGIDAAWQIEGATLLDNPRVSGSVTLSPTALATVFAQLDLDPPQGVSPADLGNLSGSAAFEFVARPRAITISNVDAQALGLRLRGEAALDAANELTGRIEIPEFVPNSAVQSLLRTAVPPTVDVTALDELALATRFDTNLATGRAALRDFTASIFGATLRGNLEALPGERGNRFRGNVTTSRFAPDRFAKAFAALLPPNLTPSELGTIALETRFDFDAAADTLTAAPLAVQIFGLEATGELTGRNVSKAAVWAGSAKVTQFSPQDLLKRFGLPTQPTADGRALSRATLDARYTVTQDRVEFTNATLALDDSKITGDFTLSGFDKPAYRFTLAVDAVDADRYLPPTARDAKAGQATAGDIELPQSNTMKLDGTMRVGSLRLAGLQFSEVSSRILVGNGDATLEGARAKLYGGEFVGNFRVQAAGSEPGLALDGKASNLQLKPLIEALTGTPANFSGTGNFDLDLQGQGRTVIQNVQTAGGNVSFTMRDGAIQGFNLGRTLCQAYNLKERLPPPPERPKQTEYLVLQGTAAVASGVATSRNLLARTSFMDITGQGTLGLVAQRLDYDFDAKLTGKLGIAGCEGLEQHVGSALPFDVHGSVSNPEIKVDLGKLAQRALREELQDRLKDRLLRNLGR